MNDIDNVLLAGAACELHPNAIKAALERDSVKQRLTDNTNEAIELGIHGMPTVAVNGELFWGDDRLEDAARAAS
jgi:2-hydroxychromene-2-carboxylate isomerase